MRSTGKFTGVNNVLNARELRSGELTLASNIDINLASQARRRAGYASVSALQHANLWKAGAFTLATRGVAGDLVNVTSGAVLVASLGHTRVWYCNLPDGKTLYSNGVAQGIVDATSAVAWSVPVPVSSGAALNMAGSLHPGKYQWALTHARTSDGLEGGPVYSGVAAIDITSGGIVFSALPVLAGHRTNVYLSDHNGGERWFAGSTTTANFMFTGANAVLQQRLLTLDMASPPVGKLVSFWRGRTLVAVGNALFASRTNAWHLFDLQRDFKQFSAPITMVQPVKGGIWVGTEKELAFLAGDTWDKLTRSVKETGAVILGSGVKVPGDMIKTDERGGRADGEGMVCICAGWLVAGTDDGEAIAMSRDRYRVSYAQVSAVFRMVGDTPQYIAVDVSA